METRPEPEHFDRWDYQRFLEDVLPSLAEAEPFGALEMVADLLEQALDGRSGREQPSDYSYIWRPAIEDHEQNYDFSDVEGQLIVAIRDVADHICDTYPKETSRVVESLEARDWDVFTRLGLYLLATHPEGQDDLIRGHLVNEELFESTSVMHEYRRLLELGFGSLDQADQDKILGWIRLGPRTEGGGRTLDEPWARHWQLRLLTIIRDALDGEALQILGELEEEFGLVDTTNMPTTMTSWVGPTSPVTSEELAHKGPEAALKLLKTWAPPGGHFEPTPLGLARQLSAAVESGVAQWAGIADQFVGLEPTYVSHFLRGIKASVEHGEEIPWGPVLVLAEWVVAQDREIEGRDETSALELDVDPSWGPSRQAVADLLSAGFERGASELPFKYREAAWGLLEPLTQDPEPTPEYEEKYGGSNMDPATLSINTVRGVAMHAVVNYALWVHRRLSESEPERANLAGMPEVAQVLEQHLDPTLDPSLAVRSVYGRAFPWLVLIDQEWAESKVDDVFPSEADAAGLWEAAWETYVIFTRPFDIVLPVLHEKYRHAVSLLSRETTDRTSHLPEPENRLVEHLLIYFLRGFSDLDNTGLIADAYTSGSLGLRSHGMRFLGRVLADWDTDQEIPEEIRDRFEAFLAWRFAAVEKSGGADTKELIEYGWWFIADRLDSDLSLRYLVRAIELAGWIEPDHEVVKRLAANASENPLVVLQCLTLLVQNAREPWSIRSWASDAYQILELAMHTEERPLATELANRLIARGLTEFKELLPEPST